MTDRRISNRNIDRLIDWCVVLQRQGWQVVRPVYVDWFWRGYSVVMRPPPPTPTPATPPTAPP